ncbi:hypothetical protein CEUSTIGMA_g6335.t1 [Chlamydomonas eustigma]|uniref:At4g15545-like C-terminal domain-containing protein n=1 Tax=Chlamydomonas eustigma TaxID=1157962 RepID=A0A250X768_9CHLO|nr:hypothetical protein CEUSTIGMA_g6335.t1 [Chlamydomonas eustigma]|eukprot:GAX78896.1 hypothetical protein CEUSTIGMA_g6335.t1 [Chlamydomonas eustigma]
MLTDLPQEIIGVLPPDPAGQLDLASKIVNFAFAQKINQLEIEAQQLRETVINKQTVVKSLERKVNNLEVEVQDLLSKNKQAAEEQHKLQTEKSVLIETVKKLNREVAKLEAFKKNLLQHLQDDDEPGKLDRSLAAVDMSSERLVNEVLSSASKPNAYLGVRGSVSSMPTNTPAAYTSISGRGAPQTSYSVGVSSPPHQASAAGKNTAATAATSNDYSSNIVGGGLSSSPTMSGSHHSNTQQMDGKQFFQVARSKLSYEQFSQFLHNIKELNAGRQNRDDTLRRVRDIFGYQHQDLFGIFEQLLNKAASSFGGSY